ncbi:hypothetical protein [Paraburkholderia sp. BL21I4N1]|uniref:hypothetical protein n=1 Tax=Paraburkholderia sp. BL21I4N1 TaxID=1938801 RepID=UPI000CFC13BC|nr:hypothetical protein [Paraburkholderia sp. BL21I4N1]PQV51958.1 hypothetical protein B0G83_104168 [Paraburkholderia sp. BL21I4N1]
MGLEKPDVQRGSKADTEPKLSSIFAKSFLAAALLSGLIVAGAFYTSGNTLFAAYSGDSVSDSDRNARAEAFNSMQFLQISKVEANDIPAAIDAMHLSPANRIEITREVEASRSTQSADSHASSPAASRELAKPDARPVQEVADHVAPASSAALAAPAPAAAGASGDGSRLTLAWVRLWDTDVEDGDVVRIESAGYSRTVTLTNHGVTFAVPVPASGQIRITGLRDGDGGGITVGLASGAAQAVLPVMSVGQVLTLNVRTR